MTPKAVSKRIVVDRLDLIDSLLRDIQDLPLRSQKAFFADRRNIWAAESCLRRSLEALFDIGRHILARGYGLGVSEYKEIAIRLHERDVLDESESKLLQVLAGYRNRLVHFYHEVSDDELFEICSNQLGDLELIQSTYRRWIKEHPEKVDPSL
jgi:uncharacterized protein YutE (UPF0331/DUF86 family)